MGSFPHQRVSISNLSRRLHRNKQGHERARTAMDSSPYLYGSLRFPKHRETYQKATTVVHGETCQSSLTKYEPGLSHLPPLLRFDVCVCHQPPVAQEGHVALCPVRNVYTGNVHWHYSATDDLEGSVCQAVLLSGVCVCVCVHVHVRSNQASYILL